MDIEKAVAREEALIDEYEALLLAAKTFLSKNVVPIDVRVVMNVGMTTITDWVFQSESIIDDLNDHL
jgi:hypothetical protein